MPDQNETERDRLLAVLDATSREHAKSVGFGCDCGFGRDGQQTTDSLREHVLTEQAGAIRTAGFRLTTTATEWGTSVADGVGVRPRPVPSESFAREYERLGALTYSRPRTSFAEVIGDWQERTGDQPSRPGIQHGASS